MIVSGIILEEVITWCKRSGLIVQCYATNTSTTDWYNIRIRSNIFLGGEAVSFVIRSCEPKGEISSIDEVFHAIGVSPFSCVLSTKMTRQLFKMARSGSLVIKGSMTGRPIAEADCDLKIGLISEHNGIINVYASVSQGVPATVCSLREAFERFGITVPEKVKSVSPAMRVIEILDNTVKALDAVSGYDTAGIQDILCKIEAEILPSFWELFLESKLTQKEIDWLNENCVVVANLGNTEGLEKANQVFGSSKKSILETLRIATQLSE